jgi:hypothetical protein
MKDEDIIKLVDALSERQAQHLTDAERQLLLHVIEYAMMEPPLTITLDQLAALHRKIEGVDKRVVVEILR